jgi:hypothetical protein
MKAKGDYQDRIHSDKTVVMIVRWEVGLCDQRPRANQMGLPGSSPLRSNGSWVVMGGGEAELHKQQPKDTQEKPKTQGGLPGSSPLR